MLIRLIGSIFIIVVIAMLELRQAVLEANVAQINGLAKALRHPPDGKLTFRS